MHMYANVYPKVNWKWDDPLSIMFLLGHEIATGYKCHEKWLEKYGTIHYGGLIKQRYIHVGFSVMLMLRKTNIYEGSKNVHVNPNIFLSQHVFNQGLTTDGNRKRF